MLLKQLIMCIITSISIAWAAHTQVPAYEYLPWQQNRDNLIQLPGFAVQLKKEYQKEKSVYKAPSKLFAVSDLEGQFEQFKKLLLAAGVIDASFNWTYGDGHLVVAGDIFDRGTQVTECLWLIYHLEEKAKAAGGYVHFILGNHELMNMTGDYRYLAPKYIQIAEQLALPYSSFYSDSTELGKWLRTKNLMEKIGPNLFLHGGISRYVNQMDQPIHNLNTLAAKYYDHNPDSLPLAAQVLLLDEGPAWYRGFYTTPKATQAQVDSSLFAFSIKRIITGHTLVPTIRSFYNGTVINIDVPHAQGASQGLIIERNKFYRLRPDGTKELLELR